MQALPCELFLSEYLTGGAWPVDALLPESLVTEGRAMFEAVARDFLDIPDWQLKSTWDIRLPLPDLGVSWSEPMVEKRTVDQTCTSDRHASVVRSACGRAQLILIDSPKAELIEFQRLCLQSARTLIIAPEFNGILVQRLALSGASVAAVQLCSDKYALNRQLIENNLPTIPGHLLGAELPADWVDLVMKPRDGAGSLNVRRYSRVEIDTIVQQSASGSDERSNWLVQPYIHGRALSVVALFSREGKLQQVWPVAEQCLSSDGSFQYLGGTIPAPGVRQEQVDQLLYRLAAVVAGLQGYIGCDLLLTPEGELLLVEINPRITSSYMGYRALARESLAPWLGIDNIPPLCPPFQGVVRFRVADVSPGASFSPSN